MRVPDVTSVLLAVGSFFVYGQTQTDQKPTSPKTSAAPLVSEQTETTGVISDEAEADFGPNINPYVKEKVLRSVRWNWNVFFPDLARPPISKQGTVAVEFSILKDGTVAGMKLATSSGELQLERAAWLSIVNSSPFPPLPKEFNGQYLRLRFRFDYNVGAKKPGFTISPVEATVAVGSTQQFRALDNGKEAIVTWSIEGCNDNCGTISATGLYTAASRVSAPPKLTVRASLTGNPDDNVRATVMVVAPKR